jgi:siroheme synthase
LDGTLVVLMGMGARAAITERLLAAGRAATTPVAVVHWGTTEQQRVVRTDLAHLPEVDLPAPAAIVVGAVAGLDVTAAALAADAAGATPAAGD